MPGASTLKKEQGGRCLDQPQNNPFDCRGSRAVQPDYRQNAAKTWQAETLFPTSIRFTGSRSSLTEKIFLSDAAVQAVQFGAKQNEWMGRSTQASMKRIH